MSVLLFPRGHGKQARDETSYLLYLLYFELHSKNYVLMDGENH